jgi:hypothetical protein
MLGQNLLERSRYPATVSGCGGAFVRNWAVLWGLQWLEMSETWPGLLAERTAELHLALENDCHL